MRPIRVAIAGVGNCASSLVQGVFLYSANPERSGLINARVGPYDTTAIRFAAAFDVDVRKVGRTLEEAIFAHPNNASVLTTETPQTEVRVHMGPVLDGIAAHVSQHDPERAPVAADCPPVDVARALRESEADVLVCYLPVGSTNAVRHYAEAALEARVAFINCIPVPIACDPHYASRFAAAGVPLIGDDVRSQVGATILHQRLVELLGERGYEVQRSYQLTVGGNNDFLNMLDRSRLADKRRSKTEAVRAKIGETQGEPALHIGPSDYIPHLADTKVAFIRVEAAGFGAAPLLIDVRLEVQDSPNSAAVVLDLVRYAALARDQGIGGAMDPVCSYYMKSPPRRLQDEDARAQLASLAARARYVAP
jgi:myo-inositol-1-phosphate synthase